MAQRLSRSLVLLFFISSLFAAPAFQQNSKDDWKEYAYESDGFAVSAPAEPAFTKQSKDTGAGTVEVHNYAIELGSNSGVMISSAQFANVQGDPKELLQNAKTGAVEAMQAKITSEKAITLQDFPGIEFVAENVNFHVRSRMYMVKGRLLTLLAIAPANDKLPPTADRVLDSFKIKTPTEK